MSSPSLTADSSNHIMSSPRVHSASRLARWSLALALCSLVLFATPFIAIVLIGKLPESWSVLLFPTVPLAVPWLPALLAAIIGHMSRSKQRQRANAMGNAEASGATSSETNTTIALAFGYTVLALNLAGLALALIIMLLLG